MSIDDKFNKKDSISQSLEKTPPSKQGDSKISLSKKLRRLYEKRDRLRNDLYHIEEALREYELIAFEFNNAGSSRELKSETEYETISEMFSLPKGFFPDPQHDGMFNKSPDYTGPDPPRGLYKDLENPGLYGRTNELMEEKRKRLKELASKGVWW